MIMPNKELKEGKEWILTLQLGNEDKEEKKKKNTHREEKTTKNFYRNDAQVLSNDKEGRCRRISKSSCYTSFFASLALFTVMQRKILTYVKTNDRQRQIFNVTDAVDADEFLRKFNSNAVLFVCLLSVATNNENATITYKHNLSQ